MGYNDVTGDRLVNKELSEQGKANWDIIFSKKEKTRYVEETGYLPQTPCQSHGCCNEDEHSCSCEET